MHTSKDERALAPSVIVKIAPAYQKAMAASEFFTQDLEEMTGGVR